MLTDFIFNFLFLFIDAYFVIIGAVGVYNSITYFGKSFFEAYASLLIGGISLIFAFLGIEILCTIL